MINFDDNSKYEGTFINDFPHGEGTFENSIMTYKGSFESGNFSSDGKVFYKNGQYF